MVETPESDGVGGRVELPRPLGPGARGDLLLLVHDVVVGDTRGVQNHTNRVSLGIHRDEDRDIHSVAVESQTDVAAGESIALMLS